MSASSYVEEISSQIPAVQLLKALGYTYLTPAETQELRGHKESNVLLEGVLADWLRQNNQALYKGALYPFTESNIQNAIAKLRDEPLLHGLLRTNEILYELLTLGTSLKQTINGDSRSYTLNYINWQEPHKNIFHVTEEFAVSKPGSHDTRRPDIVCFVNGIPLVVIECKRPDLNSGAENPAIEAISQMIGNQNQDEIPNLFVYSQLLLGISKNHAYYATTNTPRKFWSIWKEETPNLKPLINRPLSELEKQHLYNWRKYASSVRQEFDQIERGGGRVATVQDQLIWSLLRPERLLELIYQFLVFDGGVKKVARYQQYFAVKETIARVAHLNTQRTRTGGVIWHTTGSGKSLTMVMLAKALALHPNILNPRVIIVTDRINLDGQIYKTFHACGKNVVKAAHGRDLVKQITKGKADVITTVIDKFETAERLKAQDDNPNIFVLVDESHRSQYGTSHAKMKRVFPNACYIGFTGTPLLKKDKTTAAKFGGFIHKYTMRQAVDDGAVVPLLYEGRIVELDVEKRKIDRWFKRHTRDLSEEQQADLKRKFSRNEAISNAEQRIKEIAYDISEHYRENYQGSGFKAQLATSSKEMALKYKKYLDEFGKVESAILISPPDSREGHEAVDEELPEIQTFWKRMMARYGSESEYNKQIKDSFGTAEGVELLLVVDKLLTGFDEPRNRVLYIDKPLKEHNLLQAIARVNRLFEGKDFGLIIDYRGVLGELNKAMHTYNALEAFDLEDVAGTVTDVSAEIDKLPQHHAVLWDIFKPVANKHDTEQLEQHLAPEDIRQQFYEALNDYTRTLQIALAADYFYDEVSDAQIKRYKTDLRLFHNLRTSVRKRYAEAISYKDYEQKIRKLIDDHIGADGVSQLVAQVNIFDEAAFAAEVAEVEGAAAKADTIAYRMKRTATENMEKNPDFYRDFSQMIDETIQAYRDGRIDELEYLQRMQEGLSNLQTEGGGDIPDILKPYQDAPAYFRTLKESLASYSVGQEQTAKIAIKIEQIIEQLKVRDWVDNEDIQHEMENGIEDYFYELEELMGFTVDFDDLDPLMEKLIDIARNRHTRL
ncbi:MAG: type I restriction endonuclease subunit R [Anaerolineales bacterium]|nr:type I restriction endonuclease subunit R [Anaerolineales bacterium]